MEFIRHKETDWRNIIVNPYQILQIQYPNQQEEAFLNKINQRSLYQRTLVTIADDILSSIKQNILKQKYISLPNNTYKFANYGVYEAALTGNQQMLETFFKNKQLDKNKVYYSNRTLLYTCCRSGYYNSAQYLLEIGCDTSIQQYHQSTPLHAAAYYGHEDVVKLLLNYCSFSDKKNSYQLTPSEEARNDIIKDLIVHENQDSIFTLFNQLKNEGIAACVERFKDDEIIRIYRQGPNKRALFLDYNNNKQYKRYFHGTKFKNLHSILKNGLQVPGSVIGNYTVSIQADHIAQNVMHEGIQNWSKAVFVTPSPYYCAHETYAERIISKKQQYCCIVEALVKEGSYTTHKSTTLRQQQIEGESSYLEYRIQDGLQDMNVLRVSQNQNIITFAIVFIKTSLLDEQKYTYNQLIQLLNQYSIL